MKQFLKKIFQLDIFTAARLKIVFLYLLMGLVILGVAGYLVYTHVLQFIQEVLRLVSQLLANPSATNNADTAHLITQALNQDVSQMNLVIGLWLIVTMVISAYILAGITLDPVKRAMEKQKRFMGNVAHEIRTPLSVVKANTEVTLLDEKNLTHPELVEALKRNLEEIDQMSKITQFLFNFSSLENRLATEELSLVDLKATVQKAIRFTNILVRDKDIKLKFSFEDDPSVEGNAIALYEMVLNILKNAIAYTPSGGSIHVNLQKNVSGITLTIQDTGIGIPPKDIPHIFEAFYQSENATGKNQGTSIGLGLAIVKEIADMHHATISVKSDLGKGTTFIVRFSSFSRLGQWWRRWK